MKMTSIMIAAATMCAATFAADVQFLWPEGKMPHPQDNQIAAALADTREPGFKPDLHRKPYIEWFPSPKDDVKTDACMIIISGGGYQSCCDGPAFRPLVEKLISNGVTCVNLMYRTPRPKDLPIYQSAWEDGQRAVRLVRKEASRRGFNPQKIGVLGCSAGSHLSLLLATSSKTPAYEPIDEIDSVPCNINWAIPMCPAYVLTDGLAGKNEMDGNGAKISDVFKFDSATCPMCLFHGGKDPYSPIGSTQIYRQLRRMRIPAELHLDADRPHGPVKADAFERALEFMRQMEFIGKLGRQINHDHRFHPDATVRTEKEMLWPDGRIPDPSENQRYAPYLVWYIPEKLTTRAIQVIVPGGGYGFCNVIGEGVPLANDLNMRGMTAVIVKYRCPRPDGGRPKHLSAWQDAQRAIRLVRHEAPARGLDPDRIGIMGFSAGGHLTLMTATNTRTPAYKPQDDIDKLPCTVQWACPIYPAYALTDATDKTNPSCGNDDSAVLVPEFSFDEDTPPMCFVHGDADPWSAMNSVKAWERLRLMGRQSDLHTLAKRGHCFQMVSSPGTGSYSWHDRIWEFLTRKGFNKP